MDIMGFSDWSGTLAILGRLVFAALFCGIIGMERQYHNKDAGVRTYALVGVGAALFTVVGVVSLGWNPLVGQSGQGVDTTRVAAQVVSGVGFLGAGVIFVDKDVVRGLTTAGAIWLSAAIGTACGSGLTIIAGCVTILYLLLVGVASPLLAKLPTKGHRITATISYLEKKGALREVMAIASDHGARAILLSTEVRREEKPKVVRVKMQFEGPNVLSEMLAEIADLDYVLAVQTDHRHELAD